MVFKRHEERRRLESCSDSTSQPCYDCFNQWGAKYCKYTKAFKMYKCCAAGEKDGICGSSDPDVICSNTFEGLLKYQACYRDSLQCGNEIIFVVNSTMAASTTEFFSSPNVCYFKLQTYENNDQVIVNVTFTSITNADAYIIYKLVGQSSYTQEKVEKSVGENVTYSFYRYQLQDKIIYIVATATSTDADVTFETVRQDIPSVIADNSLLAQIMIMIVVVSIVVIITIKSYEMIEIYNRERTKIASENIKFQNRLGIDFEFDKTRLRAQAISTKNKFTTNCFKYKNLFRN